MGKYKGLRQVDFFSKCKSIIYLQHHLANFIFWQYTKIKFNCYSTHSLTNVKVFTSYVVPENDTTIRATTTTRIKFFIFIFSFLGEKRVSEISLFDKLMGKNVARLKKRLGRASYTRTPRASVGSHLFWGITGLKKKILEKVPNIRILGMSDQ